MFSNNNIRNQLALFFQVKKNEKNQLVKAGTLEFSYENGSQITIEDNEDCFIPTNYGDAIKHSECEYSVGITNSGTLPGVYSLTKKEGTVVNSYPKAVSELTDNILIEKEKEEQLKENPELMYDDTDDRNLRYVGANPHNYIDIGDKDSAGNKILWRIISVMIK